MSRPTNDPKEHRIMLRINEELYELLKHGNVSENARKLIRQGLSISDRIGISEEELKDLENIVKLSGGEMRIFFKDLYDKLDDYRIELKDGKIVL